MAERTVFVSEFLCSGGCEGLRKDSSLAVEGRAMLSALIADLAALPGRRVHATWDRELGEPPVTHERIAWTVVSSPAAERQSFQDLAAGCDATLVVAPEFDGLLFDRCRLVAAVGGRSAGCSEAAIALCADKLLLAERLGQVEVPMIRTAVFEPQRPEAAFEFPLVVKPRTGAGSQETYLVRSEIELQTIARNLCSDAPAEGMIQQPFIAGRALSAAANFPDHGGPGDVWPVAEQRLSPDGRFRYQGGSIVYPSPPDEQRGVCRLVEAARAAVPGLRGYVGFDLIVPDCSPLRPVLVEINPRLTTSYLGYRRLARENLASRVLGLEDRGEPVRWRRGRVAFDAGGRPAD